MRAKAQHYTGEALAEGITCGSMSKYIEPNESGLFDKAARLDELPEMGDPLARLDEVIDWTLFEPVLGQIPKAEPKGLGGRPLFERS